MGDSGVVSLYDFNSLPHNGEAQPVTLLKVAFTPPTPSISLYNTCRGRAAAMSVLVQPGPQYHVKQQASNVGPQKQRLLCDRRIRGLCYAVIHLLPTIGIAL